MNFVSRVDKGFLNTIQYAPEFKDESWLSQFEVAADVCRAPTRWIAAEFWNGGKQYFVTRLDGQQNLSVQEIETKVTQGFQKVARIFIGIILFIPGQILAVPLMSIAYVSDEIRLKHKISVRELSDSEKQELDGLIQKRQELAKERQGCEPVTCILFSICCLLCCLVCRK